MIWISLWLSAAIVIFIRRISIAIVIYMARHRDPSPVDAVERLLEEIGGYMPEIEGDVLCDCCGKVKKGFKVDMIKHIINNYILSR